MGKKKEKRIDMATSNTIIELLCVLNGVPARPYIKSVGLWSDGVCLKDGDFISKSVIDWRSKNSKDIYDMQFRAKVISMLLQYLIGKTRKINDLACKNLKKEFMKNRVHRQTNAMILENSSLLVTDVVNDNLDWYDNIMSMNSLLSIVSDNVDSPIDFKLLIDKTISQLSENTKGNLFAPRLYTDTMLVHKILTLAYMLITNDIECSNCIKVSRFNGCKISDDFTYQYYKYGKKLRKYMKKNKKSISPLFIAFLKSNPKIISNYNYAVEPHVASTLYALVYLKFIINDSKLNSFIDYLIATNLKWGEKLPPAEPMDLSEFINLTFE